MLWILTSLFFIWCGFREIRRSIIAPPGFDFPTPLSKPYLALVLSLAVLFAWPPFHTWHFERFLSAKATELADNHRAKVHCNTLFDTMLDSEMLASGHASPLTGKIVIQKPWCDILMSYLAHPHRATAREIESLNLFTHESMHVRVAKSNALEYYNTAYQQRGDSGTLQGSYYSKECAPGKSLDEHLGDSTWAP